VGAECCLANLMILGSIVKGFKKGLRAYLCQTFFLDAFSPEKEMEQAKEYGIGAKEVGLKHVICPHLEDTPRWVPLTTNASNLRGNYKYLI